MEFVLQTSPINCAFSVYCSLPTELFPSYFPGFPVRSPCRRFRLAPSQWSFLKTISHGCMSVHPVAPSASLPANGAFPKLFLTVSCRFTLSSLPSRSLPTKLFESCFPRFHVHFPSYFLGFMSVHPVVPSVPLPSNGASFKLFPTVSRRFTHVVASVPFLPNGALPKLFPTLPMEVSPSYFPRFHVPFTLSSLLSRSLPTKLFQAISHGFMSVHPVVPSVLLPPNSFLQAI